MGVYRRKDSKKQWWFSYCVAGKLHREAGGASKQQATALLAKRKLDLYEGRYVPDKRQGDLTLAGLQALWLEHASGKKSLATDRQRFAVMVDHLGASTRLTALTPADIEAFKRHLSKTITRRGLPTAPATVNRYLQILRAALRHAVANQYLHRSPMCGVKLLPEHNHRDRICTQDEYEKLCAAAYPKLRLAVIMAYHSGMRLGEITGLKWSQIDLDKRLVRLHNGTTKTGHGRYVPLNSSIISALRVYPRSIDGRLLDVDRRTLSPAFARLCRKLGIEDLRLHDLRHTAATLLRRSGTDIFTIAAITGHKDLSSLRRYNTITVEDMRLAVDGV